MNITYIYIFTRDMSCLGCIGLGEHILLDPKGGGLLTTATASAEALKSMNSLRKEL